ncbi:MAG: hypothetical protein JWN07_3057 [Hyphomicrobiales bacterium]|nr:hypothetical protein [Hyphomicrobiales bacterium]
MRLAFACLVIALPLACAQAGEISSGYRGVWAENGDCQQTRRIIIGEKTITLVEPGRARTLTDGDEAVFKGETLINASEPTKKEEDPVLAFSARLVDQNGETKLVTEGLEDGGAFAGEYKHCKGMSTQMAAGGKPKPRKTAGARPRSPYAYPTGTLLGGLY